MLKKYAIVVFLFLQVANGVVNIGFVQENQPRDRNNQSHASTQNGSSNQNPPRSQLASPHECATEPLNVPMATLPPAETPRLRIDDIIDSISVPSNELDSIKRDAKVRQGHRGLRQSVSLPLTEPTGVQVTSFTSAAPKTTVTIASDNLESAIARPSLETAVQATPV